MKIIPLYKINEKQLIKKAVREDKMAQKMIYDKYAPKMLSVCRMYIKDIQFAEDVMMKGFLKIFEKIKQFEQKGSFEGWIRKIMIREAIDFHRKNKKLNFTDQFEENLQSEDILTSESDYTAYIQRLIDDLPEGYRTVFVMYVIEEYKHKDIAEVLNISESTSRSQLTKARKMLQEGVKLLEKDGIKR